MNIEVPYVRHAFSPRNPSDAIDFTNSPSLTKQSMKAECDINNIMKKYVKTGTVSHVNKYGGEYASIKPYDLQEAMNTVIKAEAMFAELPAKVRNEFKNQPSLFLEFVQNPKNEDKIREMGLAVPKKVEIKPTDGPPKA